MSTLHENELTVAETEYGNGVQDGFQVGARSAATAGRVIIRVGLGVSMSQEAALTVESARKHAEHVVAIAAGIQGRKVLAMASGAMALFDLASDVEACFTDFPGLDAMTDADWAHVAYVLGRDYGSTLLRDLWEQAARELAKA